MALDYGPTGSGVFEPLRRLRSLTIDSLWIRDEQLVALGGLPRLRELCLVDGRREFGCPSGDLVRHLAPLAALESLRVDWDFTAASLARLKSFERLTSLGFRARDLLSMESVESLSHLPLTELRLAGSGFSDDWVRRLAQSRLAVRLRTLELRQAALLTDSALETLTSHLSRLELAACAFSDLGLGILPAAVPMLEALSVTSCQSVHGAGLAHLSRLASLRELRLTNLRSLRIAKDALSALFPATVSTTVTRCAWVSS